MRHHLIIFAALIFLAASTLPLNAQGSPGTRNYPIRDLGACINLPDFTNTRQPDAYNTVYEVPDLFSITFAEYLMPLDAVPANSDDLYRAMIALLDTVQAGDYARIDFEHPEYLSAAVAFTLDGARQFGMIYRNQEDRLFFLFADQVDDFDMLAIGRAIFAADEQCNPLNLSPAIPGADSAVVPPADRQPFRVAVIVDITSEFVPRSELETTMQLASDLLFAQTGFTLAISDFIEMQPVGGNRYNMVRTYLDETAILSDGVVVFSYGDSDQARTYGGYAITAARPAGTTSAFVIPDQEGQMPVSFIHWSHRFAGCGYGSPTAETPISPVSIVREGYSECSNQAGLQCVQHNGYSMCPNALDRRYASRPDFLRAASIVHEIMHPYGLYGNGDHFGTAQCDEMMGWHDRPFSLDEAESYNGMCPYVYDRFVASYRP